MEVLTHEDGHGEDTITARRREEFHANGFHVRDMIGLKGHFPTASDDFRASEKNLRVASLASFEQLIREGAVLSVAKTSRLQEHPSYPPITYGGGFLAQEAQSSQIVLLHSFPRTLHIIVVGAWYSKALHQQTFAS